MYLPYDSYEKIDVLLGKTLKSVTKPNVEELVFVTDEGEVYKMVHSQDCCESVSIDDICGDLQDLVGEPILEASEEVSGENPPGIEVRKYQDSFTWTFYKIGTRKGSVTIRWYGESNGYYSESVNFAKVS
jgi:hypothetical protein